MILFLIILPILSIIICFNKIWELLKIRIIIFYTYLMLQRYGLKDWKFEFDKTRLCNGQADLLNKTISMSIFFANRAELWEIKDVILHEIAHALCPIEENHGILWKTKFLELGGSGHRLSPNYLKMSDYTWKSHCICGDVYYCFHRTRLWCNECGRGLRYHDNNLFNKY